MFIIKDWADNHLFQSHDFETFEDGWDFIYQQDHIDESDYDDYFVLIG